MDNNRVKELEPILDTFLKEGNKLRIFYGKDHFGNKVIHIRSIVDDHYVVYKEWSKRKKMWIYSIQDAWYFLYLLDGKYLTKIK